MVLYFTTTLHDLINHINAIKMYCLNIIATLENSNVKHMGNSRENMFPTSYLYCFAHKHVSMWDIYWMNFSVNIIKF
jgi:hypothetical protein